LIQARPEEQLAGDALVRFLATHDFKATFEPVRDPPDLRFNVELPGARREVWAVEVTGIFEYFEADGAEKTRLFFERALHRLIKKINTDFDGQLQRGYFLSVEGPLAPAVFRALENRILEYVRSGCTDDTALDWPEAKASASLQIKPEKRNDPQVQRIIDVMAQDLVRVRIKGQPGMQEIVLASGIAPLASIPGTATSYSDVRANLDYALDRVLAAKLPRLQPLSGQYDKRVLLIWLAYPMWDFTDLYESVKSKPTKPDELDGILVVDHEGQVHFVLNHDLVPVR